MVQDNEKILILDDDRAILTTARMVLKKEFPLVRTSADPRAVIDGYRPGSLDLLLLDMNFTPGMKSGEEGLQFIKRFLEIDPTLFIVVITAYGDIDIAVKAMRAGAIDFITKPWDNSRLLTSVRNALKLKRSGNEITRLNLQRDLLKQDIDRPFSGMIGNSSVMKDIFRLVEKVAPTEANVLILGENGTGKELVARAIHRLSNRCDSIFINVDLGTISETLFESELFGHRKGAFTGAFNDRPGRFEMADGGTLFLDEIGNLTLPLQHKLLSAIQDHRFVPLGSSQPVSVDIRLISATNKPLHDLTQDGNFREDLLYRINTVEITIPPLRHRPDDIPLIADHYLDIFSRKYNRRFKAVPANVYERLKEYAWPGNVRELIHVVERAVILSDHEELKISDFPLRQAAPQDFTGQKIEDIEKNAMVKALHQYRQNISRAAKELGMGRSTFYRKMKKYGIQVLQD